LASLIRLPSLESKSTSLNVRFATGQKERETDRSLNN
jgi:hypothetical protein